MAGIFVCHFPAAICSGMIAVGADASVPVGARRPAGEPKDTAFDEHVQWLTSTAEAQNVSAEAVRT
jgi:hypothetical protein